MAISRVPRHFESGTTAGRVREHAIFTGIVKNNDDSKRMGRLAVWIPEVGGKETDEDAWIICSYASPFAGASNPANIDSNSQSMRGAQTSYGMWTPTPAEGNEVLVCFADGDINRAYWFACVWQESMNHMVPGIAAGPPTDNNWHQRPVAPVANAMPAPAGPDRPTDGLDPCLQEAIAAIQAAYPGVRVTSAVRPGDPNQHGQGKAADLNIRSLSAAQRQAMINDIHRGIQSGAGPYRCIRGMGFYDSTGDHSIHIDVRTKNAAGVPGGFDMWGPSRRRDSLNQTPSWFQTVAYDLLRNGAANRGTAVEMAAARTDAATPSAVADPTNSQRAQLGAGVSPPVVEYNKGNVRDVNAPQRANFTPLSEGLLRQGLIRDTERGVGTSSGRRESPSQVLGILSPRGNSYVADDQEGNEFIRLRTRSGTQVLIHETTGYVYINSKGGNAWLEISDDGVDIYSKNSVSIRAEKDFNIRADQNIHLDAGQDFAIRAGRNITMESGVKSTFKSGDELILESGAKTSFKAVGDFLVRTDANFRNEAAGEVSSKAGGNQIRVGAAIKDNSGAPAAVEAVPAVVPTGANLHGTQTIASRMPTHEPWPMHPRSDVPARQPASLSAGDIQRIAQRQGQPVTNGEGTDNSQRPQQNACAGGGQTRPVSTEVYNAIREASDRSGVNFGTLMAFADIESGFRPGVQARGSSATGLFQMVDGTWNSMVSRHGGTYNVGYGDRSDARGNAMMGAAYIAENQQLLQRNGLNTGPTELYMAHFLGGGGATRFLTARNSNGDQNAASMFPSAAASNPSIFYEGGAGGRPRTLNEIYGNMQRRVEPRAQAYAEQYGQPPPCERPDNDTGGAVNPPAAGNGTVPI